MAMTSSTLSKLLQPREVYEEIKTGYKKVTPVYERIFTEKNTSLAEVKDLNIIGLGAFQDWDAEGGDIITDRAYEGYEWSYAPQYKALQFAVTRKMMKTLQYDIVKDLARGMGRSAAFTIEQMAHGVFNLGTTVNGGDGVPLFSASHPTLTGTDSNIVSADLTPDSLFNAIQHFMSLTDDRGLPILIQPRILVIPIALAKIAHEILESEKAPYTAENQPNYLYGQNFTVIVSPYLTDSNDWFLLADKEDNALKAYWLEKVTVDNYEDQATRSTIYQSWFAVDFGWSDWRGVYMGQAS